MRAWYLCVLAACGGGGSTTKLPEWDKTLPSASAMGSWRGLTPVRGIIHLHSPYSHDACDGMPQPGGAPNEPCLDHLRKALCTTKIDYAALTDHDDSMADREWTELFNMRGTDQKVMNAAGDQIASRITCDDGHQVFVAVGGENELMPIMLDHHVPGTVAERHDAYNADDPAAAATLRAAGGLVWIPHLESRTLDHLLEIAPDGIEVYNLHANIDPKLRPLLGLPAGDAVSNAVEFADTNEGHPEPDLALLSFLEPSPPAVEKWNALLAMGRKIPASAGSDAHENALPVMLADGERGDAYRRVLRWFGNIALVADPTNVEQIEAALKAGRMFAVFEMMGTPAGFDIHATTATGTAELGETVPVGSTLEIDVPTVRNLDPSLPAPEIAATVWFVDATGATVAATGAGAHLSVPMSNKGAYRVEISITPHHLGPYLRDLGTGFADRQLPWIYASPVYAE
ncbi:MAG: hypothetical protein HOV81_06250 [Kofleriaceae bacterium]|nr:hypothetical protein [Kofleriaceae bacterium]